ncbi:Fructose-1,6-bisphosphatase, type I [Caenispirillum salinarum AK4]|uniref:Fructose-1,6-bisphosphatase class 1 n=1 Tax=Caenispirillum salinarum AK4 TaxID=1238182 RepID=K9GQK7_9PROT|nr:class 1 fructose-bisphosphatase [Caenispirillum salinarum]EKV27019.1 Fructose-1,6-bisphosphatase, type I [Caenispirillum salinarum AK4]
MIRTDQTTLAQYLIETCRDPDHHADEALMTLLIDVARACKAISKGVAMGALGGTHGKADTMNVQGEDQAKLDILTDEVFRKRTEFNGCVRAVASEELDDPCPVPDGYPRGPYLLVYDPLDGSSNIDINVSVGSIFSVLKAPGAADKPVEEADFLQPGTDQVAAGYAIYGPSTMLVLTLSRGVVGFTLDPMMGDFVLTHPEMRVPRSTSEFAINASNGRYWEDPVKAYVEELIQGASGPRGRDFNMRWIASMVADMHRILMRGGIYLYPFDTKVPGRAGRLRLLYEANPCAMLMEQAGGACSTGRERMLTVQPTELHQRIPLIFGCAEEVAHVEALHAAHAEAGAGQMFETPLFNSRSLFRDIPAAPVGRV